MGFFVCSIWFNTLNLRLITLAYPTILLVMKVLDLERKVIPSSFVGEEIDYKVEKCNNFKNDSFSEQFINNFLKCSYPPVQPAEYVTILLSHFKEMHQAFFL